MKRHFGLLIAVLLLLALAVPLAAQEEGPPHVGIRPDAPEYALHGPYWVGVREFEAETEFRETTVTVWYPAVNPEGVLPEMTYQHFDWRIGRDPLLTYGHAIKDAAAVTGGPFPLAVFVPDDTQARVLSTYLLEHLASHGFVVMAIDHADSSTVGTPKGLFLYARPREVSWEIDYAEALTGADGVLPGLIDTGRVAIVGHGAGARTALLAGGARLDFRGASSVCVINEALTYTCDRVEGELLDAVGIETAPEGLWPSWGDSRVTAVIPFEPDPLYFGSESLQSMTAPMMIMVGAAEITAMATLPEYRLYLYEDHGGTRRSMVAYENAGSAIFRNSCSDLPWLAETMFASDCSDPEWDMDRAHDLINHFTTAFLLDVLKGDEAAHAALAPDAVSFPGITYEAEGF